MQTMCEGGWVFLQPRCSGRDTSVDAPVEGVCGAWSDAEVMSVRKVEFLGTLLISSLALVAACDDSEKVEKPAEPQSVAEGAKAETAPGKAVEKGKQQIEAAEKQMEVRDEKIINAANPEKVERGKVP